MPPESTPTPLTTTPTNNVLDCALCQNSAWQGPQCNACPAKSRYHYAEGVGELSANFFCVAESPYISNISGSLNNHETWRTDVERSIRDFFMAAKAQHPATANMTGRFTYAVRCQHEKPSVKEITCCSAQFFPELIQYAIPNQPIMVFALGPTVLRSLGVRFKKYDPLQGQILSTNIMGREVYVYPSLSKKKMVVKTGFLEVLKQHIKSFMGYVLDVQQGREIQLHPPLEELTKDYVYPKTLDEVQTLVDTILNYSGKAATPAANIIALDTETNTKYPHRQKLKLLSVTVAWDEGRAASILAEHPDAPWTLAQVRPHLARLFLSANPKVFHNGQFDLKVLNAKGFAVRKYAWDTMAAEHLLSEDKRGYYGLKSLTKICAPQYAGYEDKVQEHVAADEAPSQSKQLKAEARKAGVSPAAPKIKLRGAAKKLDEDTKADGFANIPVDELLVYGAVDADVTRRICQQQIQRMHVETVNYRKAQKHIAESPMHAPLCVPRTTVPNPLPHLMMHHVIPAVRVLADMEAFGMAVDSVHLNQLAVEMENSIAVSGTKLLSMVLPHTLSAGEKFNPNSTVHLQRVLFGAGFIHPDTGEAVSYAGRVAPTYTATGQQSTNANFLRGLASQMDCPFSRELLQYRAMTKARNTFVENIRVLSAEDGRMHTSFHVTGTGTGRLSSSDENMQNIPSKIGKHNIKKIFTSSDPPNQVICNADAKAAEVRVYAAYSKDPNLIKALANGMDPHSYFSSVGYNPAVVLEGIPASERKMAMDLIGIDDEHPWTYDDFESAERYMGTDKVPGPYPAYGRQLAKLRKNMKRVVFGILYGASSRKVAQIVGISEEQAQKIIDILFRMFPTIPEYMRVTREQVDFFGIIETFFGRRRRLDLTSLSRSLKASAYRKAINFYIQSTSSDIVLSVLCEIDQMIRELQGRMLITVHDSLVFEVPKRYVSQLPELIEEYGVRRVAARYPWLPVPFKWDVQVGPSYGEQQAVPAYLAATALSTAPATDDLDALIDQEIRSEFEDLAN